MLEPFLYGTKAAMLDANAHILTISQFYKALSDGEFPVMWADKFANYGLPLGTIAHQIPNYLGGLLTFITHNPLISYYLLILIALIGSAIGVYLLLILLVSSEAALTATTIYTFATYRITNIYVRGAMPELFMTIWIPYILIALVKIQRDHRPDTYFLLTFLCALLILSHPMSLILYIPFLLILSVGILKDSRTRIWGVGISLIAAVALSAYYLLPLKLESKYLYMGANYNLLVYDQSVDWAAVSSSSLRYACTELNYIFWRCADISFGTFELILVTLVGTCAVIWLLMHMHLLHGSNRVTNYFRIPFSSDIAKRIFVLSVVCASIAFLLSSSLTEYLYAHISLLGSIQIPSRFLSVYYFFFAIIIAFIYDLISRRKFISLLILSILSVLIVTLQFPQIYGKNYTYIPLGNYFFSKENYHGLMVQPKWTIDSTTYPVVPEKAHIVAGNGAILKRSLRNATRTYTVRADSPVLISDSTFYFPGWAVYVDGNPTTIEFQDNAYRGVITFKVPPGTHDVVVTYQDTKIRRAGKYISLAACISLIFYGIFLHSYSRKARND